MLPMQRRTSGSPRPSASWGCGGPAPRTSRWGGRRRQPRERSSSTTRSWRLTSSSQMTVVLHEWDWAGAQRRFDLAHRVPRGTGFGRLGFGLYQLLAGDARRALLGRPPPARRPQEPLSPIAKPRPRPSMLPQAISKAPLGSWRRPSSSTPRCPWPCCGSGSAGVLRATTRKLLPCFGRRSTAA